MSYSVKPGNIFGRVGTGIGQGLAEQLPKEIERGRLQAGLESISKEKNLSPFERFSKLSSVPGITPQMLESGTKLLREEARGNALSNRNSPSPFPVNQPGMPGATSPTEKPPSLTKEGVFEKAQEGFIPRSEEDKLSAAGKEYNANPAFFGNDPQKAVDYEDKKDATNQAIANANQTKHGNLSKIQDNVVSRLKDQSTRLNTQIPADLYSKIEDKAIQATKPRSEGGGGLTEQQAMKTFGDELNNASRTFAKIGEIGNWGITARPARETLRSMDQIQQQMETLGQTDNYAKELISQQSLSPKFGYAIAEPVRRVPELNSFLKNLAPGNKHETLVETVPDIEGTIKIAPSLAEFVRKNEKASPLAIAHELEQKGYDPSAWLQYVTDHSKELNLRQRQSEQASTPLNLVTPWNDWWLSSFSGIE